MREIGIGLLGFGTVGAGVVEGLQRNGNLLAERVGLRPVLKRIADIDLDRDRGVTVPRSLLTRDAQSVIEDPSVEIVIELIGGTRIAKDFVLHALRIGKPVVTANKALLAEHGPEIFGLAREKQVDIGYEASVCAGVPIIRALREGLVANRFIGLFGILNGTCNHILTRMTIGGLSFEAALAEAQQHGYAEADPSLDIDGHDTAHKAAILASLAYGFHVPIHDVHVEGIRGLAATDIQYARDLGYVIKLLAVVHEVEGEIELRVHPTLVPASHVLASVGGVFNAVMVDGDMTGQTLYYGRGAGRKPTASAVLADVADILRNLARGSQHRVPAIPLSGERHIRAMAKVETCHYLRLSLLDKPGVLGRITSLLGRHGVSIASVLQKEGRAGDHVPVVIVTHKARESQVTAAIAEMDGSDVVGAKVIRLRIERED
jgi:homoserine dehydrogenase